jgi:hypothetical protein
MVEVNKITDLEYNELITLRLIEKDDDLRDIFTEDIKLPFSMLYRMSKENSLNQDIKENISMFFEKIISTKKEYVSKYSRLLNENLNEVETEPVVEVIPTIEPVVKVVKAAKVVVKVVKDSPGKLPKRYGKEAIKKDIEAQGGKPTNTQLTAIALNDLKNVYAVLNGRLIKDMLSPEKLLSDEDLREIRAAIKILDNKLKPILKKK